MTVSRVERTVGGLRCSEVLEHLSDWIDGELGEPEEARVREHLEGCDTCTRFGRDFRALIDRVRGGGGPLFEPGRRARLHLSLRERIRSADR